MDKDLKRSLKDIERKKNKYEKTERVILIISGFISMLIFVIIGVNIYSKIGEKISEPEIVVSNSERINSDINDKEVIKLKIETEKENVSQKVENLEKKTAPVTPIKEEKKIVQKPEISKSKQKKQKQTALKKEKNIQKKIVPPVIPEKKPILDNNSKISLESVYSIQVAAFKSQKNAEKYIKRKKLENAFVYKSKGFYRVMIGKFKTLSEAKEFRKQNHIKGYLRRIN